MIILYTVIIKYVIMYIFAEKVPKNKIIFCTCDGKNPGKLQIAYLSEQKQKLVQECAISISFKI